MDLPIHGKRVGIIIKRQRYRCKSCDTTFYEELDMMDDRRNATSRLIEYICHQAMKRTFASISDDVGVDEKTVRNIFSEYIENRKSTVKIKTPKWMGIDEIHIIVFHYEVHAFLPLNLR